MRREFAGWPAAWRRRNTNKHRMQSVACPGTHAREHAPVKWLGMTGLRWLPGGDLNLRECSYHVWFTDTVRSHGRLRTHKHIHAETHVLLTLPVMDDEGPVPGIDELRTDGPDDLLPSRTVSLQGLSFVLSLRQLFSPHYCLLYNIFFAFLGIPLINLAVVKKNK